MKKILIITILGLSLLITGCGFKKDEIKSTPQESNTFVATGDKLSLNNPYGAVKKLSKVEVKEDTIDMSDVRDDGYSMNNQQPML